MKQITSGLDSRTNRTLIGTGLLLSSVANFSDALGIPSEYVKHIITAISIIGTLTGYHFRNLTAENANAIIGEKDEKKIN